VTSGFDDSIFDKEPADGNAETEFDQLFSGEGASSPKFEAMNTSFGKIDEPFAPEEPSTQPVVIEERGRDSLFSEKGRPSPIFKEEDRFKKVEIVEEEQVHEGERTATVEFSSADAPFKREHK
jgi:hypothetical protein